MKVKMEIEIPDGYQLKQVSEGKWELVKKEEITLQSILLFTSSEACDIHTYNGSYRGKLCANTQKDIDQLIALSKLKCVADYLNDGWQPNWSPLNKEDKWHIVYYKNSSEFSTGSWCNLTYGQVLFKTKELAEKAIEICGEELLKVAFGL